jgi:hypothetical protein
VRLNNRITAIIACCAILVPVMLSVTEAMARTKRTHHRPHYREQVERSTAHQTFRRKTVAPKVQKCPGSLVPCEQAYENRGGLPEEGGWTCSALPKCVAWDEFSRYYSGAGGGGHAGHMR